MIDEVGNVTRGMIEHAFPAKRRVTRAHAVMAEACCRPVVLPEGADPELGRLLGLEDTDG